MCILQCSNHDFNLCLHPGCLICDSFWNIYHCSLLMWIISWIVFRIVFWCCLLVGAESFHEGIVRDREGWVCSDEIQRGKRDWRWPFCYFFLLKNEGESSKRTKVAFFPYLREIWAADFFFLGLFVQHSLVISKEGWPKWATEISNMTRPNDLLLSFFGWFFFISWALVSPVF